MNKKIKTVMVAATITSAVFAFAGCSAEGIDGAAYETAVVGEENLDVNEDASASNLQADEKEAQDEKEMVNYGTPRILNATWLYTDAGPVDAYNGGHYSNVDTISLGVVFDEADMDNLDGVFYSVYTENELLYTSEKGLIEDGNCLVPVIDVNHGITLDQHGFIPSGDYTIYIYSNGESVDFFTCTVLSIYEPGEGPVEDEIISDDDTYYLDDESDRISTVTYVLETGSQFNNLYLCADSEYNTSFLDSKSQTMVTRTACFNQIHIAASALGDYESGTQAYAALYYSPDGIADYEYLQAQAWFAEGSENGMFFSFYPYGTSIFPSGKYMIEITGFNGETLATVYVYS